jgi:hypothetical protein
MAPNEPANSSRESLREAMRPKQRLARLIAKLPTVSPAECTGGTTALVAEGEEPIAGPDTARCWKCGGVHLLVIEEVVVDSTGAETK